LNDSTAALSRADPTLPIDWVMPIRAHAARKSAATYSLPWSLLSGFPLNSDKGCQYTALRFTQRLADAGVAPSTGSVGDSYDNALAENLWSSIKIELLYWAGTQFATRAEAEATLLRYIDGWYNPRRIQERLGGLAPEEYEEAWHRQEHSKGFVTGSSNETPGGVGHDPV
jgi:transposase InsO family protein